MPVSLFMFWRIFRDSFVVPPLEVIYTGVEDSRLAKMAPNPPTEAAILASLEFGLAVSSKAMP